MLVLFFRVIILYLLILFAIRLMGKREVGQLQPFDFVVSMIIADLASQPLSDVNVPLMAGILPVVELLFLQVFLSYLCMKFPRIRRIVCGEAVMLAQGGKINADYMKKMLITPDDLIEMLRTASLTDINSLDSLIVETNGKANVTKKKDNGIITTLIENGKVYNKNLVGLGLKEEDMILAMKESGIVNLRDIFWGFYFDGKYHFVRKE